MSGFLQKLKSGGVVIDNTLAPDSHGVITRRVEKRVADQPVRSLGLHLSADAEVLEVAPNSPAARANIPVGFMIFEVNNQFIETDEHFENAGAHSLFLTIKLQSLASVSELIAQILHEEETLSSDEVRKKINLDELSRTTPRFSFLASGHPLFRRYSHRLRERREAAARMRRVQREVEERIHREAQERIQKELEALQAAAKMAEEQARKEEEAKLQAEKDAQQQQRADAREMAESSFIRVFEDRSTFGQHPEAEEAPTTNSVAAVHNGVTENIPEEKTVTPEPATTSENNDKPKPSSGVPTSAELLAVLGLSDTIPKEAEPEPEPAAVPRMDIDELKALIYSSAQPEPTVVSYVILPSEEYTLKSGEKVVLSLKSRSGPLPSPPPGKPPKISREALEKLSKIGTEKRDRSSSVSSKASSASSVELGYRRRKEDGRSKHPRSERDRDERESSRHSRSHHDDRRRREHSRDRDNHHSSRSRYRSRR